MFHSTHLRGTRVRHRAVAALAVGALAAGTLVAAAPAVAAHGPGHIGTDLKLVVGTFSGYDIAAAPDGTAYIAWIDANPTTDARQVNLCTLPVDATRCSGGIQTIDALDVASAHDIHVLANAAGTVTLIWQHNKVVGPNQVGEIAIATATRGLHLGAPHDVASAPSYSDLFDAEYDPNGNIWTVVSPGVDTHALLVRPGFRAAVRTVPTGFAPGYANLAFARGHAVMTSTEYGAVSAPTHWATTSDNGSWSAFHTVAHTWTPGNGGVLKSSGNGLRLISTLNDASYRPVISRWTGDGFSPRRLTADHNNCSPSSHDGYVGPSGRLPDVSRECEQIAVTSYQDGAHAAIYRLNIPYTQTYTPQIASGTRGIATVAYTYQRDGVVGDTMMIARVRLPDTTRSVHKDVRGGKLVVVGPTSCLGAVSIDVGAHAHPARGWHVGSKSLTLGGHSVSDVDGATLDPGTSYTLHGTVIFRKGSAHSKARKTLTFTTC